MWGHWRHAAHLIAAETRTQAICTFDYPGPLQLESLNCFLDFFPHAAPLTFPSYANQSFSVRGLEWKDGPAPIPIFVLFKDRVSVLVETLRSFYRYIRTPFEIILIHDNSTFPAAVHFVQRLGESGVLVYENQHPWEEFDHFYEIVADFVEEYMRSSEATHFVLTDPDCALDSAPSNILLVYENILDGLGVDVAGAALRWDDWPEASRSNRNEDYFVTLPAEAYNFNGLHYYYNEKAHVDTTFAMYNKNRRLRRCQGSYVRILPPLGVRHLDFYLDKEHLPADYKYYHTRAKAKQINHMTHLDD